MKRTFLLLLLAATTSYVFAQTQVTIKDADLGSGTYNWTAENEYILDGFVFLEAGGVLNIAAGTVIKGLETPTTGDNASTLIITQGAKINVNGTQMAPVIMTSELDDVNDPNDITMEDRSLWGGLIILGYATIGNATTPAQVEGIPTDETRARYGGDNDLDNSGSIKYLSIRHGGAELAPGNEINGLTLGGIGSNTVMEHIEIVANSDDGIEWFGGTVNMKNLALGFNADDSFDWDTGFRGKVQFMFVIQGADESDNGGELDGAIPDGQTPFSNPTIYNATIIGSGAGAAAGNPAAFIFRDATGGTLANSIITDFKSYALEVEDLPLASGVDSRQRMENGDLNIKNNVWFGFGNGNQVEVGKMIRATTDAEDPSCSFLISHITNNNNDVVNPQLEGISRNPDGNLDPRPSASGPAYTTSLAATPGGFFETVDYKGAFAADADNWLNHWTAIYQYGYLPEVIIENINSINTLNASIHVYPNPVQDVATLSLQLNASENINVTIVDMQGRVVSKPVNSTNFAAGNHTIQLNISELPSGIYSIRVSSANGMVSTQLIVS